MLSDPSDRVSYEASANPHCFLTFHGGSSGKSGLIPLQMSLGLSSPSGRIAMPRCILRNSCAICFRYIPRYWGFKYHVRCCSIISGLGQYPKSTWNDSVAC